MNICKVCYNSSIKEMLKVILFGCCFIFIWGYILFTIYMDIPFMDLLNSNWSLLFLIPFAQSLIFALINPNVDIIYDVDFNSPVFLNTLSYYISDLGYEVSYSDSDTIVFNNDYLWRRYVPVLNRKITIQIIDQSVVISTKRKTANIILHFLTTGETV